MPTPIFVCGAECNIAAVGTTSPAVEHWSSVDNGAAITVATSGPAPIRSTRAFRFNPSSTATTRLVHTFATAIASPATTVGRFYVYFASLPTASAYLTEVSGSSGFAGVYFQQSDSKIYAAASAVPALGASGVSVTTGQWYCIDWKSVFDTTDTCDVQVNGSACGQATSGPISAGNSQLVRFGCSGGGALSADVYIDDMIVSGTSGDFPIGAGTCRGLYPVADFTHNYSAATDFDKDGDTHTALNATPASETTSWQSLQNPLSTSVDTANYITGVTGSTTEYLQWLADNLPADAVTVNGVASVSTHHSASTVANAQTLAVMSPGPSIAIAALGTFTLTPITATVGVDLSDTTIIVCYAMRSGGLTVTQVNALGWLWGNTDVNPDTKIDGVCLEVDYVFRERTVPLPSLQAVKRLSVF